MTDPIETEREEPQPEVEQTYRPAFSVSFIDTIVYLSTFFGGLLCLWFGLYSPSSSIYKMMTIKKPNTGLTEVRMLRYIAWWLFSGGLVTCGGASAAIGAAGILTTVYKVLVAIFTFPMRFFKTKESEEVVSKEKEE